MRYLVTDDDVGDLSGGFHALVDVVVNEGPGRFGTAGKADDLLVGHTDNQIDVRVIKRADDLFIIVENFDMLHTNTLNQLRNLLGTRKVVAKAPVIDTQVRFCAPIPNRPHTVKQISETDSNYPS